MLNDEFFMKEAIKEAKKAYDSNEVPIGAVVVHNNKIIARAYNQTECLNDVTAHAEMLAITAAANSLGGKYLSECTLYVTVEPCPMCAGAMYWAQLKRLVYATPDEKMGTISKKLNLFHPKTTIDSGVLKEEASQLMKNFFKNKR